MADLRMNDAEKARIAASVRMAAIVAAKGRALGEDSINRIIDEASNPNLSEADRVALATSRAEQEVGIGKPLNELSATPRELDKALVDGFATGRTIAGMRAMRELAGDDGKAAASGARYDGINGSALTPAQVQTRNYAIQQGVPWAADNPEVLKLGHAAIDIIKKTQLRKDVFEGLTKDAGLSAKGAVGAADLIHKQGGDANTGGQELAKNLEAIGDKAYTDAINRRGELQLKKGATEEEKATADADIRQKGEEVVKRDPAHKDKVERSNKLIGAAKKDDAQAKATANNVAVKNKARTGAQAKMDAF